MRFPNSISMHLRSTACAVEAWASAASSAGAYAPRYIAQRLLAGDGIVDAAHHGCLDAMHRHTSEGRDEHTLPRGCEVRFGPHGPTRIIWASDNHVCSLIAGQRWTWQVIIDSEAKPSESCRARAAVLGAWHALQALGTPSSAAIAPECDRAEILHAATIAHYGIAPSELDELCKDRVLVSMRRVGDDGITKCGDVLYLVGGSTPTLRLCGGCGGSVEVLDDDGNTVGIREQRPEGCGDVLERHER